MLDYTNIINDPFPDNRDASDQWTPKSYNEIKAEKRRKEEEERSASMDNQLASLMTSMFK